jgi:leucine-zipper of insertion element IS481
MAIEEGMSPATAHRWWHRWLEAGEEARGTLSCLFDRSSRPRRSPRQLARWLSRKRYDPLGRRCGARAGMVSPQRIETWGLNDDLEHLRGEVLKAATQTLYELPCVEEFDRGRQQDRYGHFRPCRRRAGPRGRG